MTCKLCELPASSRGLCKKHYRQDLRARHRLQAPTKDPIRPRRNDGYYDDLLAFIKKELGL